VWTIAALKQQAFRLLLRLADMLQVLLQDLPDVGGLYKGSEFSLELPLEEWYTYLSTMITSK
jgi:hypothetical protein